MSNLIDPKSENYPLGDPAYHGLADEGEFHEVEDSRFDLSWLLDVLSRHIKTFSFVFALVFLFGIYIFLREAPMYKASLKLKIEPKRPVFDIQEFSSIDYINENYFTTQLKLLESHSLIRDVIDELGPADFLAGMKNTPFWSTLFSEEDPNAASAVETMPPELLDVQLTSMYFNALSVQMDRLAPQIIYVSFSAPDAVMAATTANLHAERFIDKSVRSNTIFTDDYIQGLQKNIKTLEAQIKTLNQRILTYKKEHNFFQIQGISSYDPIQDIDDRLSRIRVQLADANHRLIEAEAAYESLYSDGQTGNLEALKRDVVTSDTLEPLRSRRNLLLEQWSEVRETYLERHPTYISVLNQLMAVEENIDTEIDIVVDRLRKEFVEAETRYERLLEQEQSLIQEKYQRDEEWNTLNKLESDRDQLNDQKLSVMKDLQNAQSSLESQLASRSRTFEIVDPAIVPVRPTNRNWVRIMLLAFAAALSAAVTAVLFIEYQDQTLRTAQQIEKALGLQVLGSIPLFDRDDASGLAERLIENEDSPINDAFTALRTRLLFSGSLHSIQTVLFSSASANEGKSTVCVNLASALALAGKRVCIIDADLRKPQQHRFFGEAKSPGLSDYVSRNESADQLLIETDIPGLHLIPAGEYGSNARDLLSSPLIGDLLESLKQRFDYVFIDSAPLLATSEPAVLSTFTDTTLIVTRSGKLTPTELDAAIDNVKRAGGSIFAIVLNGAKAPERRMYHAHSFEYAQNG